MKSTSRRVLGITLLIILAALLVFLIDSIVTFQPKQVLSAFLWRWVWTKTLIYGIEALIPLQCTALILYYSLFVPAEQVAGTRDRYEPFYRLVNSVLVLLLVFTVFFSFLAEGLRPWLYGRETAMLDQTKLAHLFFADYQAAHREQRYSQAEQYLTRYLRIDPSDADAQRLLDQAKLDAANQQSQQSSRGGTAAAAASSPYQSQSAQELTGIAQNYFKSGDYASARYYATLALTIEPHNQEAQGIADESVKNLARITPTAAQRAEHYLFALKTKGRSDLEQGKVLDAYYLFHSLSLSHPKDPDVQTYLTRATDELTSFAFFKGEIDQVADYPGQHDLLFVNRRTAGGTEIVLFRKMVALTSGTYVVGIEAAEFSPTGKIVYHLTAPYGRLMNGRLSMFCVERSRPVRYLPKVLSGHFPDSAHYQLPLSVGGGTLQQMGSYNAAPGHSGLPHLWSLAGTLPQLGYDNAAVRIEFLRRVMVPFGFLIFAIFSIAIGWSFRVTGRRPSYFVFLLLPLVPYVVSLFESFYLFAGKILFAFVMVVAGFWPALLVLLGLQFVLVIIALVYLAGQSTEFGGETG